MARTTSPQAQFDESLGEASDASLTCDGTEVAGAATVDGGTITFDPEQGLPAYTECTATFQVEDTAGNTTTETVTFTTVLPQEAMATGSDADDVTEVATDTTAYWRVQTEWPDGTFFDVRDADRVLWVEDGEVHDLTGDGADALYLRRPDKANHEVTVYYELDGTWLQLTATYNQNGYLATVNGDPHRPDQVGTEPAASGSDASDVTLTADPDYYRVETRDASGTSFDVRDAQTVLWVEDGQV